MESFQSNFVNYVLNIIFLALHDLCTLYRFFRVKRPAVLSPLIPMSFVLLYYGDLSYGTKLHRINLEAEMIMEHEKELLEFPCDLPTVASIDSARIELDEESRLHPPHV